VSLPGMKTLPKLLLLFVFTFLPLASINAADLVPPLTKDDARRVLEAMEWREVNVIAVVQGVNEQKVTAPSLAMVLAFGRRDGEYRDLKMDLFYDQDLGWFAFESTPKMFRLWTRNGYREIKAGVGG